MTDAPAKAGERGSEWTEIHPDSIGVFFIVDEALTTMAPGIKPPIRRGIAERIARRISHELLTKKAARDAAMKEGG